MRANKPQSANPSSRPRQALGTGGPKTNNFVGAQGHKYNIAAIMKKFKNEGTVSVAKKKEHEVTHAQRNTLLEPNNFIPSWEAGGEERKEVSRTLRELRQKFDKVHKTVEQRQKELDDMKRQLAKTTEEELYLVENNSNKTDSAVQSKGELEALQEEHDFEKLTQHQYLHML